LRHRLPDQEHQDQHRARREHVGAALERAGHGPGQPLLEARAGHHAVLQAEQDENAEVERERDSEGAGLARVDRLGDSRRVREERDQVQEGREEDRVARRPIAQGADPAKRFHVVLLEWVQRTPRTLRRERRPNLTAREPFPDLAGVQWPGREESMDFSFSAAEIAYRDQARAWLKAHMPSWWANREGD